MAVMGFFAAAPSGLIVAMVQDTVRPDQRATGAAGIILTPALIGTGIAPALIGYLSDAYAPAAGLDSLRLALLTIVLIVAPLLCLVFGRILFLKTREMRRPPRDVTPDRKSVVEGTCGSVRVDLGGGRLVKKK